MPRPDFTSSMSGEKNLGHAKPDHPGSFVGQTSCKDQKVKTGGRYKAVVNGQEVWIPIKELRTIHYWIWGGREWLDSSEFSRRYSQKPKGKVLVSKHDFDAIGNPVPKNLKSRR